MITVRLKRSFGTGVIVDGNSTPPTVSLRNGGEAKEGRDYELEYDNVDDGKVEIILDWITGGPKLPDMSKE
jgi:hypothetical protein